MWRVCNDCGKTLASSETLRKHKKSCKFSCNSCGIRFTRAYCLKRHQQTACKGTKAVESLPSHMAPRKCDCCSKHYATQQSLCVHEKKEGSAAMASMKYKEANAVLQFPDEPFADGDDSSQEDEVMLWRELPQNIWLRIIHQQDVNMECGIVKILHLLHRDDSTYKAWSTIIITKEIDDLQRKREEQKKVENLPPADLYIRSLGKRASKSNPTRSYFDFKLMYF